jgi:DNA replication protein DnaC
MGELKLYGMQTAYDEVMGTGIKRQHEPPRIVGDLLSAEIAEKQARSIKYQLTTAKLPLAKDLDDFDFSGSQPDFFRVQAHAADDASKNGNLDLEADRGSDDEFAGRAFS